MKRISLLITLMVFAFGVTFAQTSGGPDDYGYTWANSDDANGPAFNWVDITSDGTEVTGLSDDSFVGPINMGISFKYYWIDRTEIYIGSNGYLTFSGGLVASTAVGFPACPTPGSGADDVVAPFMADLTIGETGNNAKVYYKTDGDRFIVTYENMAFWTNDLGNPPAPQFDGDNTFQVIFDATDGTITFQYLTQSGAWNSSYDDAQNPAVIGIENVSGQIGLMVSNNQYFTANTAIQFTPPTTPLLDVFDATPLWVQNTDNGGFFAVRNGQNFFLSTQIGNVGNVDLNTDVTVNGLVADTTGQTVWISPATVSAPFTSGASQYIEFGVPFSPAGTGPLSLTVTTTNTDDINNFNDSRIVEVVSIDTTGGSADFSFASGDFNKVDGVISWSGNTGNSGGAVYMEPHAYPVILENVDVLLFPLQSATSVSAGEAYAIEIFDDDGPKGTRGTLLFSSTVMSTDVDFTTWNTVAIDNPVVIGDGGFYVSWLQRNDTVALFTETTGPISRRTYEILDGNWAPYRNLESEDFWIRVGADVSLATTPNTGIKDEFSGVTDFNVYPNPTTGIVNIDLTLDKVTDIAIRVYNMNGQKVHYGRNIGVNEFTGNLDLSNFGKGLYMIQIETPTGQETKKVLVH